MSRVTTMRITDFAHSYAAGLSDEVLLLDVRTRAEFSEEHLHGAINVPLDEINQHLDALQGYNLIYIYCRTGSRSHEAGAYLAQQGIRGVVNLDGSLVDWKEQNNATAIDSSVGLSIDRQVKLIAGSGVLISITLAYLLNPAWLGLALFIGAGLTFAGSSGICALAILLARMPWNRQRTCRTTPQVRIAGR